MNRRMTYDEENNHRREIHWQPWLDGFLGLSILAYGDLLLRDKKKRSRSKGEDRMKTMDLNFNLDESKMEEIIMYEVERKLNQKVYDFIQNRLTDEMILLGLENAIVKYLERYPVRSIDNFLQSFRNHRNSIYPAIKIKMESTPNKVQHESN